MLSDRKCKNSKRKTRWNQMWKWECGGAVRQYPEICVRYCVWFGGKSRQEIKKAVDYTGGWV